MTDLGPPLVRAIEKLVEGKYSDDRTLRSLVNAVVTETTDFEHIMTFLDSSVSNRHREFAKDLRRAFEKVLRDRLGQIKKELGSAPIVLYEALLDMYELDGIDEVLAGILTLNYDEYLEEAIEESMGFSVDFGIDLKNHQSNSKPVRLLKMHGSFGWTDEWPISRSDSDEALLWIPPGIRKTKERYPFNVLWGHARELLDCDIVRVVGCKLGPNDWDLISLLFTSQVSNSSERTFKIEIIDSPRHAMALKANFPYLNVRSMIEVDPIGRLMISELLGGEPRSFDSLDDVERATLIDKSSGTNWFRWWLTLSAEVLNEKLTTVKTRFGKLEALLEAY